MPIDYKNYAPNWQEIRQSILERAENRCEQCSVPNYKIGVRTKGGTWFDAPPGYEVGQWFAGLKCIRIVLTVAHLDHNIGNNDPSNLAALCQRCHNRHDAPMRARNRKARRVQA